MVGSLTSKILNCGVTVVVVFFLFKTVSPHVSQYAQVFAFILGLVLLGKCLNIIDSDFRFCLKWDKVRLQSSLQLNALKLWYHKCWVGLRCHVPLGLGGELTQALPLVLKVDNVFPGLFVDVHSLILFLFNDLYLSSVHDSQIIGVRRILVCRPILLSLLLAYLSSFFNTVLDAYFRHLFVIFCLDPLNFRLLVFNFWGSVLNFQLSYSWLLVLQ